MSIFEQICKDNDITPYYYDEEFADRHFDGTLKRTAGGAAVIVGNKDKYIFIDRNITRRAQRYVEAHELGHILLGHLDKRSSKEHEKCFETEADIFAAVFTAMEIYEQYKNGGRRGKQQNV